jgi:hypothetical protein
MDLRYLFDVNTENVLTVRHIVKTNLVRSIIDTRILKQNFLISFQRDFFLNFCDLTALLILKLSLNNCIKILFSSFICS